LKYPLNEAQSSL